MIRSATAVFALVALACLLPATGQAQLAPYGQDFEMMVQSDPAALSSDGWLYFANVFSPDGTVYYYGYGPGPAPNGTGAFCNVAAGEGGAAQGAQQLVVFSDYNNGDHAIGNLIESNVFQERVIGAENLGQTWTFSFDAKMGDLQAPSTAFAFIKTLDPNAGYAMTNFLTEDMTSIPNIWGGYTITIDIVPALVGQILQFGFLNNCSNYVPSGVFYDNVQFYTDGPVAVEDASWGQLKSRF